MLQKLEIQSQNIANTHNNIPYKYLHVTELTIKTVKVDKYS